MRVQIPPYTDRWMMGDRYGEVVKTFISRTPGTRGDTVAVVKLDKSGKTIRVILDDCVVV